MRALALALTLLTAALPVAARENHALLIGANSYPRLEERFWLKGPSNDVDLVQRYLTGAAPVPFAPGNVTVLTDGLPGGQAPTLGAIRAAFAALTARVEPGDFVWLHFSGHGSQAPAADPAGEPDGLDELFLPVDIGPWSDSVGHVENALTDDEIAGLIGALRAKGADVFAVFDSCHSGTVTRAAPPEGEEVRLRQLPPEALGLTAEALEEAAEGAMARGLAPDPRAPAPAPVETAAAEGGTLVAFFAAQSTEVTPEKRLPRGAPDRRSQGVFTFTLLQVLAEYPQATWGQIADEVLRRYAMQNLAQSTPLFEGDLGATAFGLAAGERVRQWPAVREGARFTLPAGQIHGLAPGVELAVMPSAAAADDAALGLVRVTGAEAFAATAEADPAAPLPAELPEGVMLRRLTAALDFSLSVALPEGGAPAEALARAMADLEDELPPRITLVPAGAEADLRLAVLPDSPRPDALWILPGTGIAGDLRATPSVSTADKDPGTLARVMAEQLAAMARAANLLKLGAAVGSGPEGLRLTLLTRTAGDEALRPLPRTPVPTLLPGDEVHVKAVNDTAGPVDLNVLYVAADWSISHWFAGRLHPGDVLEQGLFRISDSVLGAERLVVVITPAAPQSAVEDLSFLAQPPLDLTRSAGATPAGLIGALREAGYAGTTRGAVALGAPTDAGVTGGGGPGVLQLDLRTVAAPAD
jgi:hypothetical protein